MKVKVLYFASLRERVGRDAEEIDVPAGIGTISGLQQHLRSRGGEWERAFSDKRLVRAALNQDMVNGAAPIKAGDEVAFFPPVTGG